MHLVEVPSGCVISMYLWTHLWRRLRYSHRRGGIKHIFGLIYEGGCGFRRGLWYLWRGLQTLVVVLVLNVSLVLSMKRVVVFTSSWWCQTYLWSWKVCHHHVLYHLDWSPNPSQPFTMHLVQVPPGCITSTYLWTYLWRWLRYSHRHGGVKCISGLIYEEGCGLQIHRRCSGVERISGLIYHKEGCGLRIHIVVVVSNIFLVLSIMKRVADCGFTMWWWCQTYFWSYLWRRMWIQKRDASMYLWTYLWRRFQIHVVAVVSNISLVLSMKEVADSEEGCGITSSWWCQMYILLFPVFCRLHIFDVCHIDSFLFPK